MPLKYCMPDAEEVAAAAAPLPAGLHGHVAAEIVFLTQMAVDGEERRARGPVGSAGLKSAPNWNSHGFAPPSLLERPARLRVQPQAGTEIRGHARHQRFPHVIDPREAGILQQKLVPDVGTDVVVAELRLPRTLAGGQQEAAAKIDRNKVLVVFEVETRKCRAFDVQLPALRPEIVVGAIAQQADAAADRGIPRASRDCDRGPIGCPSGVRGCRPSTTCTSAPGAQPATTRARR